MIPAGPEAVVALEAAGVAVAYVFGSRARGTARPDSDLDLAVLLTGPAMPDLLEQELLAVRLADVLDVPSVDLLLLDQAPLELRARVVREGRLLHSADEPRRVRFEVDTQSRWFDVAPAHADQTRSYLRHLASAGLHGR